MSGAVIKRLKAEADFVVSAEGLAAGITRLKTDGDEESRAKKSHGMREGASWALRAAKHSELKRLDKAAEDAGGIADLVGGCDDVALALCEIITGESAPGKIAEAFWENVFADHTLIDDPDFAEGFVDGALIIWDEASA